MDQHDALARDGMDHGVQFKPELEAEEDLVVPVGPMTRARAKRLEEGIGGLLNQMYFWFGCRSIPARFVKFLIARLGGF
ncbi:unnamed protein product [Arabis nemorensis]|uniref:Uncharacterized protein n=1 Tax=Arabis nemorensis TaxID=586526 RepID=A0A565BIR0_9BRAS|nr:unnamed protein product [Arabis nemorensis]